MGREWQRRRSSAGDQGKHNGSAVAAAGCMSGMFHFLDLHHLLFSTIGVSTSSSSKTQVANSASPKHPELLQFSHYQPKGVEAPRNSLDVDNGKALSTSCVMAEEYDDIPVGIELTMPSSVMAKKNPLLPLEEDRRSTDTTPRTPNLVARLMGLDILPEKDSSPVTTGYLSKSVPCSLSTTPTLLESHFLLSSKRKRKKEKSQQKTDKFTRSECTAPRRPLQSRNCNVLVAPSLPQAKYDMGSRSLADTPRVSSARSSWDTDRRLSLQVNKENYSNSWSVKEVCYLSEEVVVRGEHSIPGSPMTKPRMKSSSKHQEENYKSPNNSSTTYASEVTKQMKGNISSRTFNGASRGNEEFARSVRTTTSEKKVIVYPDVVEPWKPPPMCSPPSSKFLEQAKKLQRHGKESKPSNKPLLKKASIKPKLTTSTALLSKCKGAEYEKFTERSVKQLPAPSSTGRRELPLVQSTHSSPPLMQIERKPVKNGNNVYSVRKPQQSYYTIVDEVECSGLKLVQVQWKQKKRLPKEHGPEFQYVRSILVYAGILGKSLPSFFRWYSPSRPIDPLIFHKLELHFPDEPSTTESSSVSVPLGTLRHRWNRKLLFHLVQEILTDIPELSHITKFQNGEKVLQRLWKDIRSFPEADCKVIGDIDALVEGDLAEASIRRLLHHPSVTEESEELVVSIQGDILDSILTETAASLALSPRRGC